MKIALGNDHAGYPMKKDVIDVLKSLGVEVIDFGSYGPEKVDFPDIARKVCNAVRQGRAERGIMVCGTGVGPSIAANKIPGIRASICHDIHCAHQCVEHDDVNVMCIGAQIIGPWLVRNLIPAFIKALLAAVPSLDPKRKRGEVILEGDVPSPMNPPPACRFHTRCPRALARCREEEPLFHQLEDGRWIACHLYS